MALINGLYVFIDGTGESISDDVTVTTHPIEQGSDIADHILPGTLSISLSGMFVDNHGTRAIDTCNKVKTIKNKGDLISYVGSVSVSNMLITKFSTKYDNSANGAIIFDITLVQAKLVNAQFNIPGNTLKSTQKIQQQSSDKNVYHIVQKGDCRWNMAQQYNSSIAFITSHNPQVQNWQRIQPGDRLCVCMR